MLEQTINFITKEKREKRNDDRVERARARERVLFTLGKIYTKL